MLTFIVLHVFLVSTFLSDGTYVTIYIYIYIERDVSICNFHIETYLIMLIRQSSNSYNLPVLASLVAEITGTYGHTQIVCDFYKNKFWVLPHINFTIDPQ